MHMPCEARQILGKELTPESEPWQEDEDLADENVAEKFPYKILNDLA